MPAPIAPASVSSSQLTQPSKESTPMPDSVPGSTKSLATSQTVASNEHIHEARSLAESLNMTMRYIGEYMNENPLLGEPGSFILSSTHGNSQSKSQSQGRPTLLTKPTESEVPEPLVDGKSSSGSTSKANNSGEKSPTTPGMSGKPKRRKSKGPSAS